jgi:fatty-acyl-CoA synthase
VNSNSANRAFLRALEMTAPIPSAPTCILPTAIEDVAEDFGERLALLSEREYLTYRALAGRANRFARWALDQGLAKGDIVCLMMPNRPEYMTIWLGLTSVGVVVSLINTNLLGSSLAHCVDTVAPKCVIVAAELSEEFHKAAAQLANRPQLWGHGGGTPFERIDQAVEQFSGERLTQSERRAVTIADRALLIYTSGTTGLPKAANVSHRRILEWSFWFAALMNIGPDDRMYDCLPMYHSIGGVVATGAVLVRGGSVLIREKFSTHQFWNDVIDWDCTLVQYVGELCRYLLNAPKNPRERAHRVRMCCGNGLRADVWEKFQARFQIPRILEFYAATEGAVSLYNVEAKVGAIGRVPFFLSYPFPLALVNCDGASGELARDANGFCIRCAIDEVGEAVGRMRGDTSRSGGEFEGYTNARDSEQKILRDVFERGDTWYRTGDLMRMDASGFFYFIDRIGDTFRWKGENVSATEIAEAITAFPGILEASVYGVAVPGTEGAAGMAAIVSDGALDFVELRKHLAHRLAPYARPLFLRVVDRIEATVTFKHTKDVLRREGYDPAATGDSIYFDDPAREAFVRLDRPLYARIQAGEMRV